MKKSLFLTMLLVLVFGVLAACGSDKASSGNKGGKGDVITITFGHGAAETNVRHEAALKFKDIVEKESNGKMKVEVYPNETIGSEAEMLENVSQDSLNMALAGAGVYTQYDPKIGAVNLPYLFDSYEQAWKVLDGKVGDMMAEPLLDDNIRILAFFENGMRQLTNSKRPIKTPKDLKGLSIRTPEAEVSLNTLKAMGANATPMAFGELYLALQQGTVDGQENPLANIAASKFSEVQKYLSLTAHQYDALPLAVSDKFWQTLTEDQQKIIKDAAHQAAQFHREAIRDGDAELLKQLQEAGMKVNEVDKAPFKEAVKGVYDSYAKKTGQDFIDTLLEEAAKAE